MNKKWLIGYEYEALLIVDTQAEAEEMILTFAEAEAYEADLFYGIPKSWKYSDILMNYGRGYWLEEVPCL